MAGESSRLGSNCGYQLTPAQTEFRYAIDEGSERRLMLSGGTAAGPEQIRVRRGAGVVAAAPTVLTTTTSSDVCRNHPPRDARWWSALIDDEVADAIRHSDTSLYRVEALVDGQWQRLRLHDSGCRWKGAA